MADRQIIVVGAGAAGLMAAGTAARAGAHTVLLEKNDACGRKLLMTGNGRCNFTNIAPLTQFLMHLRPNGQFLRNAFAHTFSAEIVDFFKGLGVESTVEADGKIFPTSGKARDIVDAVAGWAKSGGADFRTRSAVAGLITEDAKARGVRLSDGNELCADAIILTTGGASYSATGSSGDGYRMAEAAGHRIVPLRPALVPLVTEGDTAKKLQGLSLENVTIRMWVDGKKRLETVGEMLFTHFGLSGPAIISMSGTIVDELLAGHKVALSICLIGDLDERQLDAMLVRQFAQRGKQKVATLLTDYMPRRLAEVCMQINGIAAETLCSGVTSENRRNLRAFLKDFCFEIVGSRPLDEAMVTAGGVDTREVDPRTMESKLVKGLYFAGEILDVDGDTGGYNLQAAFSTGALAGRTAAR